MTAEQKEQVMSPSRHAACLTCGGGPEDKAETGAQSEVLLLPEHGGELITIPLTAAIFKETYCFIPPPPPSARLAKQAPR